MKITQSDLPGVVLIEPQVFSDSRGMFMETYNSRVFHQQGINSSFLQDNISYSTSDVLRGLHLQNPCGQNKLVYVLDGEVFDVAVDVRRGSPNFGRSVSTVLSGENRRQIYIPEGFAHGYCVLSDTALLAYKCTAFYRPDAEITIAWNDPDLAIDWPCETPRLSDKDGAGSNLADIDPARLPVFDDGVRL